MTQVVVLAAGKGKRMNSELPKVLLEIKGKPIIKYLIEEILASGVCSRPAVVVGYGAKLIKETLGETCDYIFQAEQLGTGQAVACTKKFLEGKARDIMVFYGDHPFIKAESIKKLEALHQKEGRVLTMMTSPLSDFNNWRQIFYQSFGRILRNEGGEIIGIVEAKDASVEQKKIREINPGYYCFKAHWLWENLEKLAPLNEQKEYYLTDLVKVAIGQGQKVASLQISAREALGINTPEEREIVDHLKI